MDNQMIRERVVAAGFTPEHVDMVTDSLTKVAENAIEAAKAHYIDQVLTVGAGSSEANRFSLILSAALGQPKTATGRWGTVYRGDSGRSLNFWSDAEIRGSFGRIEGITTEDNPVYAEGNYHGDPFPVFRFAAEPADLPVPLNREEANADY